MGFPTIEPLGPRARESAQAVPRELAHALRTPLNSILALSQLLLDDAAGPLNPEQRSYLETILRSGRTLLAYLEGERPPEGAAQREAPAETPVESHPVLLLVEDDECNRFTLSKLLGTLPVTVQTAANSHEAIERCRPRCPALVLLDLHLPDRSGLETARTLRAMPGGADAFLVALTGDAEAGTRERLLAEGFDAYLAKPIDLPELTGLVTRTLARSEGRGA